jgi:hypothetical protein
MLYIGSNHPVFTEFGEKEQLDSSGYPDGSSIFPYFHRECDGESVCLAVEFLK